MKGDQPLRAAPDARSDRRGSASREARLPLFGARPGPGCHGLWLHVGPQAWTCSDDITLSGASPIASGRALTQWARPNGLPYQYYFASQDGSLAYRLLQDVDIGEPVMTLEPGFAIAVVEERTLGREQYGRTNRGLWVPMRDFGAARPLAFHGERVTELSNGEIPFAWVVVDRTTIYAKRHNGFVPTGRSKQRFDRVDWLESAKHFGRSYVRIAEKDWLRTKDVRHPTVAPPPDEDEISRGARWLDVELATQTVVAFAGTRPMYATLVSTGKGKRKGHPFETPKGVHRIWVKLLSTTMDNLENDNANRYWRIEDVPYVQFFHNGVGFHGAFWHRSFGHVRSHGCVNLAPLDAQRLFSFTGPRVAAGWSAALPSKFDKGTIVRVR